MPYLALEGEIYPFDTYALHRITIKSTIRQLGAKIQRCGFMPRSHYLAAAELLQNPAQCALQRAVLWLHLMIESFYRSLLLTFNICWVQLHFKERLTRFSDFIYCFLCTPPSGTDTPWAWAVLLWCASSVSLLKLWRPPRAVLIAGQISAMSVLSSIILGEHRERSMSTSSRHLISDQR